MTKVLALQSDSMTFVATYDGDMTMIGRQFGSMGAW